MCGDGFEHLDSLAEILLDASVGVDEGGPVSALNMNTAVVLQLVEDVLHRLFVNGFNRTVGIQKKLRNC